MRRQMRRLLMAMLCASGAGWLPQLAPCAPTGAKRIACIRLQASMDDGDEINSSREVRAHGHHGVRPFCMPVDLSAANPIGRMWATMSVAK